MAKSEDKVELIAVHTYIEPKDYFTEEAYHAKIESLFRKIDEKRAKGADGAHRYPAIAGFPENIGTFLGLVGMGPIVRGARSVNGAMTRIAPFKIGKILRAMARHRTVSLNEAMFIATARRTHKIYFSTFSGLARKYKLHVNAGSALLPKNSLGDNTADFKAASHHVYNTSYTFDPHGDCINVTRKVNVVPTMEDVLDMSAGRVEDNAVMGLPFGRTAVAICYDAFAEPHTEKEPDFKPLALHYDRQGADIILQPSANPWFWNEPWIFNAPDESLVRRDQWMCEGLFGSMQRMKHVRYGVNPHVVGRIFDVHFDGKSYIYERVEPGGVSVLAESARSDIAPETEEILLVTVPWLK